MTFRSVRTPAVSVSTATFRSTGCDDRAELARAGSVGRWSSSCIRCSRNSMPSTAGLSIWPILVHK